jgi:hypothetical protein
MICQRLEVLHDGGEVELVACAGEAAQAHPKRARLLGHGRPAPKGKVDRLVRLEASIRIGGALKKNAVVPDALFGLRFNDETESYFMLEVDRGEMPIERYKNIQRTYYSKKMLTYYEANRQQRHVHDLGIENFRVLTVTTDRPRIEKMLTALDTITDGRGSNIFLFADQATLSASNPLEANFH